MVDLGDVFNEGMDTITFGAWSAASMAYQSATSEIADGVAKFANKTLTLMGDLDAVLYDADKLLKIRQYQSRHLVDLTPDERAIIYDYQDQEDKKVKQYTGGATDTPSLEKFILDYNKKKENERKPLYNNYLLASEILDIRKATREIMWNKPGVVPETISNVKAILEKVRSVDQPMVEKSLDGVNNILSDADALLKDADTLLLVKRAAPRSLSSFSPEESKYLGELRTVEADTLALRIAKKAEWDKLKNSGATDQQTIDRLNELDRQLQDLMRKYDEATAAIEKLFYTEPGIIPDTVHDIDQSIRQFTPKVTSILTDADELLKQIMPPITDTIKDIDSLLTIRRTAPRDESELNEDECMYLADLRKHEKTLDGQIKAKEDEIARLKASGATDQQTKDRIDVLEWELGNVKQAWENNYREIIRVLYTQPGVVPDAIYALDQSVRRFNMVEQPKIESIMDSVDDTVDETAKVMAEIDALFVVRTLEPAPDSTLLPGEKGRLEGLLKDLKEIELNIQKHNGIIPAMPVPVIPYGTASRPSAAASGKPTDLAEAGLPSGVNAIGLGTMGTSFPAADLLRDNRQAYLKQLDREKLKFEQQIERIRFKEVKRPGVIPKILSGVSETIERLNKEDQPRFEKILDNVNGSLEHTKGILGNVDDIAGKAAGLANRYGLLVKIGLGISGVAIIVTLVLIPVLLFRMILFGL
jgi:hypothetical protein